ncbi:hypothetical protein SLA2020_201440 [Shorea laevis]
MDSKWISTVASIWIQSASGSSYTFGIYSSVLKSSQSYDQSTLDTISVFKDVGANVGILSGLLYSAVVFPNRPRHHRHHPLQIAGPWVVHAAGAVQCFAGYFLLWATVVRLIEPPVLLVCLFMLVAAHGQTFFNTANVVSGVQNFQDFSGTIVGILKGFLGLSGAILIQVYDTLCEGEPSTYILILALTPTLVSLLLMTLVRIYEQNNSVYQDKKHLNAFSAVALIIAGYLMILILLENIFGLPLSVRIITFMLLLLLLASPLGIAIRAQREELSERLLLSSSEESSPTDSSKVIVSSKLEDPSEYHEMPEFDDNSDKYEDSDISLFQAVRTWNFWLIFVATVCGMGSGLATINNISQIGESLSYTTIAVNSLVSLWSIWNFLGRFSAGYVSDALLHKRGWPRPIFMAITLGIMSIGHLIVASGFPGNLYIGSVLVGICYGSQWSLMPIISSEIFGVRHFGTIFNTIAIASPVGSYIFSVRVIGYFYDKEASGEDNSCYGTRCFMISFLIMASVAAFGCLVAVFLFFRTRRFYRQVVLRRLQHSLRS